LNRPLLALAVAFLAALSVDAQISVDTVSTDTVDILGKVKDIPANSSQKGPLFATILLPGTGHQAIGKRISAMSFLTVDVVAACGMVLFHQFKNKTDRSSRAYASQYAGVGTSTDDGYYWDLVGSFATHADYRQTLDLMREPDSRFDKEEFLWAWEDEYYRKEFVSMQKSAKRLGMASSFFLGAMIVNRIVAFINMRTTLKKNNTLIENARVFYEPDFSVPAGGRVTLTADF